MSVTEIWVSAAISVAATKQLVNCRSENSVNSRVNCESTVKQLLASIAAKPKPAKFCQIPQD